MNIIVLTGAGISAESGISTFRASDGLWNNHRVEDVASVDGWNRDFRKVLAFYNERRRDIKAAQPNGAHQALADLEKKHDVTIITQNIDDLHERAGSTNVIHLHGEIMKSQSWVDPSKTYPCAEDIKEGDKCPHGKQLRPFIVWFGEHVARMQEAEEITKKADALVVVGTSLQVYPAAGLVFRPKMSVPRYIVDPSEIKQIPGINFIHYKENATTGVAKLVQDL